MRKFKQFFSSETSSRNFKQIFPALLSTATKYTPNTILLMDLYRQFHFKWSFVGIASDLIIFFITSKLLWKNKETKTSDRIFWKVIDEATKLSECPSVFLAYLWQRLQPNRRLWPLKFWTTWNGIADIMNICYYTFALFTHCFAF